eukprot:sb/3478306/
MGYSESNEEAIELFGDTDHNEDWWIGSDPVLGSITLAITLVAVLANSTAVYYISTVCNLVYKVYKFTSYKFTKKIRHTMFIKQIFPKNQRNQVVLFRAKTN